MTFNFAPYAIDGARTTSALARLAAYTTGGGRSGVAKPDGLKVVPLEVPGNGLRITAGGATILNHYQSNPDQVYVVSNPSTHVVPAASMPAPAPTTRHFLVCVVVGDTEFNQTGHPFMPTTLDPGSAATFEYVRIVLVPCAANTSQFEQLGLDYPAYALARVEIPPNTSTITAAMITNLRTLAQPRQDRQVIMGTLPPGEGLGNYPQVRWPSWQPVVAVPPWATKALMIITLSGIVVVGGETQGGLRGKLGDLTGGFVAYDIDNGPTFGQRQTFIMATSGPISQHAGTNVVVTTEGYRELGFGGSLQTWGGDTSHCIIDITFYEDTI